MVKSVSMKREKFFIVLNFVLIFCSSFCFSKGFSYSVIPYYGLECSTFDEAYYYEDRSKYSDRMCSFLTWTQNYSQILGLENFFTFGNANLLVDVSTKIPSDCGLMKDSDFAENGLKFNYSISDVNIENAFSGKISFSYSFDCLDFKISPSFEAFYDYINLNARNGHGWYGSASHTSDGKRHSWDSPYAHYYPDGIYHLAGVDYQNQSFGFFAGVVISKNVTKNLELEAGFHFSPFTYSYAKDHHLGKNNNFYTEDFIYHYFNNIKISAGSKITLYRNLFLMVKGEVVLQKLTKGEDYENGSPNNQKGGESYNGYKIKLGLGMKF